MNAIVINQTEPHDDSQSFRDAVVDRPAQPQHRDLLVRIHAISINPVDTKIYASMKSQPTADATRILGWDAVGEVVAAGPDAKLFHEGERVWYAGDVTRQGSYAEYQLVDERIVGHAPTSLDDAHAAAMPLTSITAWEALFDKLGIEHDSESEATNSTRPQVSDTSKRQTLLVVGAAGGVGSMIIQFAHRLTTLRIIALASRDESKQWALDMGADEVVDYHSDDLAQQIQKLAPEGVDWIFSAYSKSNIGLYNTVMKPFGEIVAIDDQTDLDWYSLMDKALSWHWEFMFARSKHHAPDMIRQHEILDTVANLVDSGIIRSALTQQLSPIHADSINKAHLMVKSGHMVGKVAIADKPQE
ncbi:zinc-binding alcohol dehydrogenase family protein [Bifidobacterium aquikefiricola]|uniref:Zinc-type alcohol dehydrogenase-like protein n=1 Tax=Bifidobacterium aquikefiricola TaxID=3059038 RepID=A0AB39U7U7_9BIFI